jgi:hypothetical protein
VVASTATNAAALHLVIDDVETFMSFSWFHIGDKSPERYETVIATPVSAHQNRVRPSARRVRTTMNSSHGRLSDSSLQPTDWSQVVDGKSRNIDIAAMIARLIPGNLGGLARSQFLWIVLAFWLYVAVSNVLYAAAMQSAFSPATGAQQLFAPWPVRMLQHLLLFPAVLLAYAMAMRIGWAPRWRATLMQIALAMFVSILARPALSTAGHIAMLFAGTDADMHESGMPWHDSLFTQAAGWFASFLSFAVAYGFGLALLTGLGSYRRLRDRELQVEALQNQWTRARLAALKLQLSPHTLFNLLHTIRGHITWDPPAAQKMVVQLADLLRKLLSAGEREMVSLRDELQFVSLYLRLQQQRFKDRLSVVLPDPADVPPVMVPSLILQPLVENAVVHGVEGNDLPIIIELAVDVTEDRLMISIDNTLAVAAPAATEGIGLANVRERLEVQFGSRAALESAPGADGGWRARVTLPRLS